MLSHAFSVSLSVAILGGSAWLYLFV